MYYQFLQEIYQISEEARELLQMIVPANSAILYANICLGGIALMFIAYYLLKSFGLYKMAVKRGLKNPKLCFVPFCSLFMLSKLRSECGAFKKHSYYPVVAVSAIGTAIVIELLVDVLYCPHAIKTLFEVGYPTSDMFSNDVILVLFSWVQMVAELVYIVFTAMLFNDLFRTYSPFKASRHTFLSILFYIFFQSSLLYGVFTLALSSQAAINYDEFIEKRRIYYGNPYGRNPYNGRDFYGNGQNNGNGQNGGNANYGNQSANIDPFTEFSNGQTHRERNDDPFADFNENNTKPNDNRSSDDSDSLF